MSFFRAHPSNAVNASVDYIKKELSGNLDVSNELRALITSNTLPDKFSLSKVSDQLRLDPNKLATFNGIVAMLLIMPIRRLYRLNQL